MGVRNVPVLYTKGNRGERGRGISWFGAATRQNYRCTHVRRGQESLEGIASASRARASVLRPPLRRQRATAPWLAAKPTLAGGSAHERALAEQAVEVPQGGVGRGALRGVGPPGWPGGWGWEGNQLGNWLGCPVGVTQIGSVTFETGQLWTTLGKPFLGPQQAEQSPPAGKSWEGEGV